MTFLGRKLTRHASLWISYDARATLLQILPRETAVLNLVPACPTCGMRGISAKTSVEDNAEWFQEVKKILRDSGLGHVRYVFRQGADYCRVPEAAGQRFDLAVVTAVLTA